MLMGIRVGVGCRAEAVRHGLTVIVCTVAGVDLSSRVALELVARHTERGALVQPQEDWIAQPNLCQIQQQQQNLAALIVFTWAQPLEKQYE